MSLKFNKLYHYILDSDGYVATIITVDLENEIDLDSEYNKSSEIIEEV